jgi:hypothetical protein
MGFYYPHRLEIKMTFSEAILLPIGTKVEHEAYPNKFYYTIGVKDDYYLLVKTTYDPAIHPVETRPWRVV